MSASLNCIYLLYPILNQDKFLSSTMTKAMNLNFEGCKTLIVHRIIEIPTQGASPPWTTSKSSVTLEFLYKFRMVNMSKEKLCRVVIGTEKLGNIDTFIQC